MVPYMTTTRGMLFDKDCLQILSFMKSESIDCVFADPPFNIGKDYKNGYEDKLSAHQYLQWSEKWIEESCRILKPGGAIFIYATPELAIQFGNILNKYVNFRHWIALTMKGTFSRGKKLYPAHYALLYYTRGEPQVFNKIRVPIPICRHCGGEIKDYGGHRNKLNPKGLNLTDFWEDTSPNRHSKFKVRPGVNELKLIIPERAIQISTEEDDIVFDPFGGGGSTYQAAEINNRFWIGTELFDSAYIEKRFTERFPLSVASDPIKDLRKVFKEHEDHKDQVFRRSQGENL